MTFVLEFIRSGSHIYTTCDELSKTLLVSERIPRTQRPCAATHRRRTSDVEISGPGHRFGHPLLHANAVGQCWMNICCIKAVGYDRHDQYHIGQKQTHPEVCRREDGERHALVLIIEHAGVHRQDETEIEYNAPPYYKMVETSPIGCIQGTL